MKFCSDLTEGEGEEAYQVISESTPGKEKKRRNEILEEIIKCVIEYQGRESSGPWPCFCRARRNRLFLSLYAANVLFGPLIDP